jgi:hypothetical protein
MGRVECGPFGQHPYERAALGEHRDHPARRCFHQPLGELLPHPLGDQRIHLAVRGHRAHQRHRLRRDVEPESRSKARNAQDADRVFGKCGTDVPQYPQLQVARTAERVDDVAVLVLRDGIDGQVAARKVILERDVRRSVDREALVAGTGLALGARQRVLLARDGVEKDREVLADRLEPEAHHLLRRRADHDVIAVLHREPEELVADRAADLVDLHGGLDQGIEGLPPISRFARHRSNFPTLHR